MRSRIFIAFIFYSPAFALYQEYQIAGSAAASPGYSFATAQYRVYGKEALLRKDYAGFEYDLDSLYGDYGYGFSDFFRGGLSAKGHFFDYQNLNHIVDASSGAEVKSIALNAPFVRAMAYLEVRHKSLGMRYSAGAQKFDLAKRDSTNTMLTITSPGIAFVHQIALGYWDINQIKPYAFTGVAAYLSVEAQKLSSIYVWQQNGAPITTSREEVIIHELHLKAGQTFAEGDVKLMAALRGGATNFSLPGATQDLIQSFSVGGPEARYRRIAGYSFSEFRVPAFSIVNLDAVIRVAGPVNLWLIADGAAFDREYNSTKFHGGAGAGFIIDLPDGMIGSRSAAFARFEMPFAAAGTNRFQIFLGMNGQIF